MRLLTVEICDHNPLCSHRLPAVATLALRRGTSISTLLKCSIPNNVHYQRIGASRQLILNMLHQTWTTSLQPDDDDGAS